MMRWWLDKGVDGFRMDVINMISKVSGLPDAPEVLPGPYQWGLEHFMHGPRLMEFLNEMHAQVLSSYDVVSVGETPWINTEQAAALTDAETGPLSMVFQFEHMNLDKDPNSPSVWGWRPWSLLEMKQVMGRWQMDLARGWNSNYFSNHDQPRQVSRFGDDGKYRVESAKLLGTFLHLLQGTPYIYQGEEIGMTNVAFDDIEDYRDIWTRNEYQELVGNLGMDRDAVMALVHMKSRDNARTPMQWDTSEHAGFTTGTPWIKVNPNYAEINVDAALADPDSVFYYYQKLIHLRHQHAVIVHGRYDLILDDHEQIYAFTRTLGEDDGHAQLLVILNFSAETPEFVLPDHLPAVAPELLIANYPVEGSAIQQITLRPYEARVYLLR
jgi:oligo-1,6-glucosidase